MSLENLAATIFTLSTEPLPLINHPHNAIFLDDNRLRFTLNHRMRDPHLGFLFGSDASVCDVLLEGSSTHLFALYINGTTGTVLLINTSAAFIELNSFEVRETQINLRAKDCVRISSPRSNIQVHINITDHHPFSEFFQPLWEQYCARVLEAQQIAIPAQLQGRAGPWHLQKGAGPYQFQTEIGNGFHGIVYLAFNSVGNLYAVKHFNPVMTAMSASPLQEAAMLQRLRHVSRNVFPARIGANYL